MFLNLETIRHILCFVFYGWILDLQAVAMAMSIVDSADYDTIADSCNMKPLVMFMTTCIF